MLKEENKERNDLGNTNMEGVKMKTDVHVWILEDDPGCNFVYNDILNSRYSTRYFTNLNDFIKELNSPSTTPPSIALVDLYLPDGCLLDYLSHAPKNDKIFSTRFIVISSVNDIDALRFCFTEGALDYFTKPFHKNELLVKLEKIIEENPLNLKSSTFPKTTYAGVHLDIASIQKKFPDLTKKEVQILEAFLKAEKQTIERQKLIEQVWENICVHPKTLDVHLYNLRKKIEHQGMEIVCLNTGVWSLRL